MAMALVDRGIGRQAVEIAIAVDVPDVDAFAARQHDVERLVIVGAEALFGGDQVAELSCSCSPRFSYAARVGRSKMRRPKRLAVEFHENAGALAAIVEERIEFDEIERRDEAAVGQHFHDEMRFAERRAAGHGGADARREIRIEKIDIEADVQQAVGGADRRRACRA